MAVSVRSGHVPFQITARLRGGMCVDQPYGADLAGLIAAQVRRRSEEQSESASAPTLDLPLSICGGGGDWHWLASCVQLNTDPDALPEARTFFQVADLRHAHQFAIQPLPHIQMSKGPYRDVMQPSPVMMCSTATWWGVGDLEAIRTLLTPVRFIGRRRATGEGRVLSWAFEELDGDPTRIGHLGTTDEIVRPCPTTCADELNVPYRTGWYALRPPSWDPDLLVETAMAP